MATTYRRKAFKLWGFGMKELAIFAAMILAGAGYLFYKHSDTGRGLRDISLCKDEIKKVLKDPKTAEFEPESHRIWKSNSKTQSVTFSVRAANSFGAFSKQRFSCSFDENGKFQRIDA